MPQPHTKIHFTDAEEPRDLFIGSTVLREPDWIILEHRHGASLRSKPFLRQMIPASRIRAVEEWQPT